MKRLGLLAILSLLALSQVPAHETDASADEERSGRNLRITIVTGDKDDPGYKKSYRMLAVNGGPAASMLVGWRMPIPASRSAGTEGESATAYVYHNIGVSATVEARLQDAEHLLVQASIEVSGKREPEETQNPESGMPVIGTFQQELQVLLKLGEALRVAEVTSPEGRQLYLELMGELLD